MQTSTQHTRADKHPSSQEEDESGAQHPHSDVPTTSVVIAPVRTKKHEAATPLAVYTGLLRRDTKVILPIFDGWEKLLDEADDEVKRLVAATLEQVITRCLQLREHVAE